MIIRCAVASALALSLAVTPAFAVGKKSDESWAKPGVTFAAYNADALDCANRAYGVNVTMKPVGPMGTGYLSLVLPSALWTSLTPGKIPIYTTTYVEAYRNAARIDTIEQLQAVVDTCLGARGYQKFQLTADQATTLRKLQRGSIERARYLHGIAADARTIGMRRA